MSIKQISAALQAIGDEWSCASNEVRRGACIVVGVLLFFAISAVVGIFTGSRALVGPRQSVEHLAMHPSKVVGRLAFKQECASQDKWAIAIVWGESAHEWNGGNRVYMSDGHRVFLLRGSKNDDFSGVVSAAGIQTAHTIAHLNPGEDVRLSLEWVGGGGTVTRIEKVVE